MSSYMQMGYNTRNLLNEKGLENFTGVILSPVNQSSQELHDFVTEHGSRYDTILDPQLYYPQSRWGRLASHDYFPSDLDTADCSSLIWWKNVNKKLSEYVEKTKVRAVVSPCIIPNRWDEQYFSFANEIYRDFRRAMGDDKRIFHTVLVNISDMADTDTVMRWTSILAQSESPWYYLVVCNDVQPRREFRDAEQIAGVMRLISALKNTGSKVLVAFTSSDMILWKAAGASICGTGKYFNLRRFTKSRFRQEDTGFGQKAYWFEESLLAFLGEADYKRIASLDSLELSQNSQNFWGEEILTQWKEKPGKAWLALGWRQYLNWFCISANKPIDPESLENMLLKAQNNWKTLGRQRVFMEDRLNDGKWITQWLEALKSFNPL